VNAKNTSVAAGVLAKPFITALDLSLSLIPSYGRRRGVPSTPYLRV
jgi:hypothetical protein